MANLERVQSDLLEWYARHARDLPWRRTRDPYAILVAEVMLQQTQVDRVIPKWHAWLDRFPTLAELALASKADAIRAWHGLGYNLRAVRLHAIACDAVAQYDGELPRGIDRLMGLKGIGRYTAAAVACFAYEQPVGVVDTNVRRVLSRVFDVEPARVEDLADKLVPIRAAYPWNQALMDLGATLCRARRPLCLMCPLVSQCAGPRPMDSGSTRTTGAFNGSRRFYRGRIVEYLRGLPAGQTIAFDELVAIGGEKGELIGQLATEGLIEIDEAQRIRLAE